ncbi:glycosyltransferase family 4 protein [Hyphococcus sp.]|uniref:glycosyltransferase family 4 protein n=1 Tax=Hyphococcus sp. TaxID=2038636 RepID=UPI003750D597
MNDGNFKLESARGDRPIRSLLVSSDAPSTVYGTGRRLAAIHEVLSSLGECRTMQLVADPKQHEKSGVDYLGAAEFAQPKSRLGWARYHLTFREFRRDKAVQECVRAVYRDYPFDLLFCSFFRSSGAACFDLAPCVIDTDAIPEAKSELTKLVRPVTELYMRRCASLFDGVLAIRESDRRLLAPVESYLLPAMSAKNATPIAPKADARNLLFVGSTRWRPNEEAALFLADKLAPAIHKIAPDLMVRLVGEGTDAIASRPGLSTAGFVDDLKEEYKNALLVLCPIWSGSGASVKLGEAIQHGAACAASAYAASGFETLLAPNGDLMVSASRDEFVKDVCALAVDHDRIAAFRARARERASDTLSHARFEAVLVKCVMQSIAGWNNKRASRAA